MSTMGGTARSIKPRIPLPSERTRWFSPSGARVAATQLGRIASKSPPHERDVIIERYMMSNKGKGETWVSVDWLDTFGLFRAVEQLVGLEDPPKGSDTVLGLRAFRGGERMLQEKYGKLRWADGTTRTSTAEDASK